MTEDKRVGGTDYGMDIYESGSSLYFKYEHLGYNYHFDLPNIDRGDLRYLGEILTYVIWQAYDNGKEKLAKDLLPLIHDALTHGGIMPI